ESADAFVGSAVAHDADGLHGQQNSKGLGGLPIPAGLLELLQQNGVRLPKNLQPRRRDRTDASHRQARPGEGMTPNQLFRKPQLLPQAANFILEELFERLDQLESQFLGQPADVVMRLDCCSRAVAHGAAFDYVRIKRPLGKELRVLDALGFILEDVDKDMTDEPPLFLWIGNAG